MKFKKILMLCIIVFGIILIPIISNGAEFYDGQSSGNHEKKRIANIWFAMDKYKEQWIDTNPGDTSGEWESEYMRPAMIDRYGAVCVGHNNKPSYHKWGDQTIKSIYTTYGSKTDNANVLKLAYLAMKSIETGETHRGSYYKGDIRIWAYYNAGLNQKAEVSQAELDRGYTKDADAYAASINNEKIWTNSSDTEGATQQIIYKDENTFIGPYHLGNVTGSLNSATIKTREGVSINTTKCSIDGNEIKDISSIGDINSNNFYIVVEQQKVPSVESITITKKYGKIKARIVFTQDLENQGQNVSVFYAVRKEGSNSVTLPGVPYSQINVKKVDSDTEKGISNIGIIVRDTSRGYIINGSPATYTNDINKATVYITNSNGLAEVKNLKNAGTFEILEVINPYYGYASVSKTDPKNLGQTTASLGQTRDVTVKNEKQTGNLKITKKDTDNRKTLKEFSFKIKDSEGKYIIIKNDSGEKQSKITGAIHVGSMETTDNKNEATEFITNVNGEIQIYNILKGRYIIEEISVGNNYYGYELDENYISWMNYSSVKDNKSWIRYGKGNNIEIYISRERSDKTEAKEDNLDNFLEVLNQKKYIRLSGYVWEDKNVRDNLYNSENDKLVKNVTVRLKDKDGNIVNFKTETGETVSEILTGEDGKYTMVDVLIDKLDEYYVEFEYNGMSYQSVATNIQDEKGSKATDGNSRNNFDNNFATIRNNESLDRQGNKTNDLRYDSNNHTSKLIFGDNPIYGYDGQKYPINQVDSQYVITANTKDSYIANGKTGYLTDIYTKDKIRKDGMTEIGAINLGVYERLMPDMAIVQDIENVKLHFENTENNSNYDYTYNYNQRFTANKNGFDTNIKYGTEYEKSYERKLYTADVLYNSSNAEHLKMNVTYKIGIRNESKKLYTSVKEMENYFDSRYEVVGITNENGTNINYKIDQNYDNNGLKKLTITDEQNVGPDVTQYIYIEYRVKDLAIKDVLNGNITLTSGTEIKSYSSYENSRAGFPCAGIDVDSNPGNMNTSNKDTYEDDSDIVKLDVSKEAGRTINGTIWEDTAIETLLKDTSTDYSKQRKGDGKYVKGENVVKDVKVELIDSNTKETIKVYKEENNTSDKSSLAETTTNNLGEYTITGVIPGKYQVKYTYGNTSIICDTRGNETGTTVKAENYKSTIYRGGNKEQANSMDDYWYRTDIVKNGARLSDAKDEKGIYKYDDGTTEETNIVEKRTTEEEITYKTANKEEKLSEIQANSHNIDITIDFNGTSGTTSNYGNNLIGTFDNVDFGIIERPRQDVIVKKEVAYIQLVLDNGQIISEGDPRTGETINHLKVLPDGRVFIEADQEIIQSATLKVTYAISVNNKKAEIDYNSQDYYIYGTVPNNNEGWRIATITRLYDYLSNELAFDDTNADNTSTWTDIKISSDMVTEGYLSEDVYKELKKYNRIYQTTAFSEMTPNREKTVYLQASRMLANGGDEYEFENAIEVNGVKYRKIINSTPGNYIPSKSEKENDADDTNIVVTLPTGENKNYIPYITLGVSVFGILAAGIAIIKKKVL